MKCPNCKVEMETRCPVIFQINHGLTEEERAEAKFLNTRFDCHSCNSIWLVLSNKVFVWNDTTALWESFKEMMVCT